MGTTSSQAMLEPETSSPCPSPSPSSPNKQILSRSAPTYNFSSKQINSNNNNNGPSTYHGNLRTSSTINRSQSTITVSQTGSTLNDKSNDNGSANNNKNDNFDNFSRSAFRPSNRLIFSPCANCFIRAEPQVIYQNKVFCSGECYFSFEMRGDWRKLQKNSINNNTHNMNHNQCFNNLNNNNGIFADDDFHEEEDEYLFERRARLEEFLHSQEAFSDLNNRNNNNDNNNDNKNHSNEKHDTTENPFYVSNKCNNEKERMAFENKMNFVGFRTLEPLPLMNNNNNNNSLNNKKLFNHSISNPIICPKKKINPLLRP